jgi:hypothetical protein
MISTSEVTEHWSCYKVLGYVWHGVTDYRYENARGMQYCQYTYEVIHAGIQGVTCLADTGADAKEQQVCGHGGASLQAVKGTEGLRATHKTEFVQHVFPVQPCAQEKGLSEGCVGGVDYKGCQALLWRSGDKATQ